MVYSDYEIAYSEKCLKKIERIERIDPLKKALDSIYIGLYTNPYSFKSAPPIAAIRYAKAYCEHKNQHTQMTVLFMIIEDDKIIKLLDLTLSYENDGIDFLE